MIIWPAGYQPNLGDILRAAIFDSKNMENARVRHCRIRIAVIKDTFLALHGGAA